MDEIIFKMPVSVAMKLTSQNSSNTNVSSFALAGFFAPCYTKLGGEFSDVFVILKICPKFNFGAGFFLDDFPNYGDGWRNVSPRAAPYY